MNHTDAINALEKILPQMRESGDIEGTLLSFAKQANLAPAQLGLLSKKFNTARFLTHLKKAGVEDKAGNIPIVDPEEIVAKYMQVPSVKQASKVETTWTPSSGHSARSALARAAEAKIAAMEEVHSTEGSVAETVYAKKGMAMREARETANQVIFDCDVDLYTVCKKAEALDIAPDPFIFGEQTKVAQVLFSNGTNDDPAMETLAEARVLLKEAQALIDVREEAERIVKAANIWDTAVEGETTPYVEPTTTADDEGADTGSDTNEALEADIENGDAPADTGAGAASQQTAAGATSQQTAAAAKTKQQTKEKSEPIYTFKGFKEPKDKTKGELLKGYQAGGKHIGPAVTAALKPLRGQPVKKLVDGVVTNSVKRKLDALALARGEQVTKGQLALRELILSDPVISEYDADDVADLYEAIYKLNPLIARNAPLVRGVLRESLQYGAIPLHLQSELAKMYSDRLKAKRGISDD